MGEYNDQIDDTIKSFHDLSISDKYSFNSSLVKIVDVTVHTIRQVWVILRNSLPYELDNYLSNDYKFPQFDCMNQYVNYSSIAYVSIYSAGAIICQVTKPDPKPPSPKLIPFNRSSKSKSKNEQPCVVIIAISVLKNHTGLGLSLKLYDHTINKLKSDGIKVVYALVDENSECTVDFYSRRGFHKSNTKFNLLTSNLKVECSRSPVPPSFVIMEMALGSELTK
ncbi:uncharacterized protein TOT_040000207 [Theileria orientalis strain Shintoku]|uniref:N-acetyltransferase domain-containing protein n=1 Tax=Theileria orientalis strain Shintoku TaxID=869250 RepID=J4CDW0_THEOR|nr:uncharacterized protein TOT_040000207 [Theileria orientalis strain Shintoku]PVC52727.1 hypothetical protein MACL_00000558 [Theileria orientalis]BAM41827.1 uncharacterized protein TOT_040000207 [Theileria orientalis strain Shintoku]|eukprot:XP_009692128.1 uncharacterized protein TOT_040000207 [Theileria orientalis strain Shintoku]